MTARLKPAFDVMDRAIADDSIPGGVLAVGLHDKWIIHPFGKLTRDAKSPAVTANTLYDMASLTKVIVTTTSVMILMQQKRLDLDTPVARYLPEWAAAAKSDPDPTWRARVTIRNLLLHDSGLPAHRDFYKQAKGHDAVLARVFAEPLVHEPGTKVEYSDLGFHLARRNRSTPHGSSARRVRQAAHFRAARNELVAVQSARQAVDQRLRLPKTTSISASA